MFQIAAPFLATIVEACVPGAFLVASRGFGFSSCHICARAGTCDECSLDSTYKTAARLGGGVVHTDGILVIFCGFVWYVLHFSTIGPILFVIASVWLA